MTNLGPSICVILLPLLVLGAAPGLAQAQSESFGVSPGGVQVHDAISGQTYERQVHLQNRFPHAVEVHIEAAGVVGAWTTSRPPTGFIIHAMSDLSVALQIAVPGTAARATHEGEVQFTALGGETPDGTGYALQHAVAVRLAVTVGDGTPYMEMEYPEIMAHDIELGDAPRVFVRVANTGNLAAEALTDVRIVRATDGAQMAKGTASGTLNPGQETELPVAFEAHDMLPLGTYLAVAEPAGAQIEDSFKVVPPGDLGKDGILRGLLHDPRVPTNVPVRIEAPFVNVGEIPIGRVKLDGEVHRDGRLVATFASEPLAVDIAAERSLIAYFTPDQAGTYILTARATYDGFQTPVAESMLVAGSEPGPLGGWLIGFLLGLLATLILILIVRRRKARDAAQPAAASRRRDP